MNCNWNVKRIALFIVLVGLLGCGQPQMGDAEPEDYHLLMQLRSALGAKQLELLEQTATRLQARHEAGKIPPAAYQFLQSLVEQGRAGEWETAHEKCLRFMKAQRPTNSPLGPPPKA